MTLVPIVARPKIHLAVQYGTRAHPWLAAVEAGRVHEVQRMLDEPQPAAGTQVEDGERVTDPAAEPRHDGNLSLDATPANVQSACGAWDKAGRISPPGRTARTRTQPDGTRYLLRHVVGALLL